MARRLSIDAICRLIETLLPGGYPVIDEVAQLLQVSPRTLQLFGPGRALSQPVSL